MVTDKVLFKQCISKNQNPMSLCEREKNTIVLAKYQSTHTSRPTTSHIFPLYFQNSQAPENIAAVYFP